MEKTLMTVAGRQEEEMQKQEEEKEEDELVVKEGEIILSLFDHHPDGTGSSMQIALPLQGLASRIPYFATLFSEPWNASSTSNKDTTPTRLVERPDRPPVVLLECSPLSSCKAYYRFFELLKSAMADSHIQPFPQDMLGSIGEAVQLLPVADHLLFQECIDVCMKYLARRPWSVDEEALIRTTLLLCFSHKITATINPDLQARLDSGSNMDMVFECTCIFLLSPKNGDLYPPGFFRTCLKSGRSKPGIQSLLMRIWVDETPGVCKEVFTYGRIEAWMDLTLSLLEYHANARTVVKEFAEKPDILSMYSIFERPVYHRRGSITYYPNVLQNDSKVLDDLLIQVFKHASSGNVPLSNSECLALLKMWEKQVQRCSNDALFGAFLDIYKTLPLNDKAVFDFACMEAKRFAYLSSQLLSYVSGYDIVITDATNQ